MSVSPLALLREWPSRTDGSALHEFVLIGTDLDLPALERDVLPAAHEKGAAVTVLGAAAPGAEPAAVSRPDRTLALIERTTPHPLPELVLLVGDGHVTAAFGGGAPAAPRRPWTVVRGGPEGVPWAFDDLGAWLRGRAGTPSVPDAVARRLTEVAERLEDLLLTAPVDGPARSLHDLEGPLLSHLPRGPVDRLCLYAPLRGAVTATLRSLGERLAPTEVELMVPQDWPKEDTEETLRSLSEAGLEATSRSVPDGFPRHGGLLEWVGPEGRRALTLGSHLGALTRADGAALTALVPADAPPEPAPDGDDDLPTRITEELEASGWTCEVDSGVYRIHGSFTNPVPVAARVVELLDQEVAPVLVHAQGPKAWALLVWKRPMMLLASAPRGSAWRLYRVDPPATPASRLGGEGLSQVGLLRTSAPLHRAPHRDVGAFLDTLDTDHITLLEKVGFLDKPL
ncbi:hypothetical protein [Nocardiopsis sp. MG754419]|uniref:hypothetical protein n=1 Tax=Nocardiopsis sp. MG754419 TaxID=2259865 RepID=UPI001BA7E7CE|nr:hypothetical protein [Nocardiopsis sp. MG754419]MBR8743983.1 hypothetical protein [Nocardiopsis sp. MG754419]